MHWNGKEKIKEKDIKKERDMSVSLSCFVHVSSVNSPLFMIHSRCPELCEQIQTAENLNNPFKILCYLCI